MIRETQQGLFRKSKGQHLLLRAVDTDGKSLEWKRADGSVVDLARGGQMVFSVVSVHQIEIEVRETVARIDGREKSRAGKGSRRKRATSETAG